MTTNENSNDETELSERTESGHASGARLITRRPPVRLRWRLLVAPSLLTMHVTFRRRHPSIRIPKRLGILTNDNMDINYSIAGCHSEMPSFAAQLRLFMVIHLFRINVAFTNA